MTLRSIGQYGNIRVKSEKNGILESYCLKRLVMIDKNIDIDWFNKRLHKYSFISFLYDCTQ